MYRYDKQQERPIFYCDSCGAEIYKGNECYTRDKIYVVCCECHEESNYYQRMDDEYIIAE